MSPKKKQKGSPKIFVVFIFVVIFIIMISTNLRSRNIIDITIPGEVIEDIYTIGNNLIAINNKKTFFVWDWDDIQAQPLTIQSVNDSILSYSQKIICSYSENNGKISLKDIDGRELKSFNIDTNCTFKQLKATRNSNLVGFVALSNEQNNRYQIFQLGIIDINEMEIKSIYKNSPDDSFCHIENYTISEDGSLFAVAGKKGNSEWIALFDMKSTKLVWEKFFPNDASTDNRLDEIAISADNKLIAAGLLNFYLYTFDSANGNVLNKMSMEQKLHAQKERLRISGLQFSLDGTLLAAGYEPPGSLWLWDVEKTGKKPKKFKTRNRHVCNIAFSNDSKKIVSAGIAAVDSILIWQLKK